ncbi:hypothetical protein N9064_00575 [bacterium]|nr:hypothetical protein [bacterium]
MKLQDIANVARSEGFVPDNPFEDDSTSVEIRLNGEPIDLSQIWYETSERVINIVG